MAMGEFAKSLQSFDLAQLGDMDNVSSWPMPVKVVLWGLAFAGVLAGGYLAHVTNLQDELGTVRAVEERLRADYEGKFLEAVHLEGYRRQQRKMEDSFQAILRQLPSDTEIPGLIEDITLLGVKNGLTFESIDLEPETRHEFYVEKPIRIVVNGVYHGLASFVSDVADLSRIVTLHDFSIAPDPREGDGDAAGSLLRMQILAKTYRYNDEREP